MKRLGHVCTAALALLALVVSACGGPGDSSIPIGKTHPDPIASLSLENQSVLEFYEIDHRVLIMETGPADVQHVPFMKEHADMVAAHRLVDLYTAAAKPSTPVPSALAELQSRYPALSETDRLAGSTRVESVTPPSTGNFQTSKGQAPNRSGGSKPTGPQPQALDSGCGNGCCDRNWVTNSLCTPNTNGATFSWLDYEFGNSYENSSNYWQWWAAVCAGVGTSTWRLNPTDGGPFVWTVNQGYYLITWDSPSCSPPGSFCLRPSVTTTVNDPNNNHIHDYCGGAWD